MPGSEKQNVELTGSDKGHRTHRVSEFLAAAGLERRNYRVSMETSSSAADLMVKTRGGKQFWVKVKGLSSKADWLAEQGEPNEVLFYILVYLNPLANSEVDRQPDHFYVLTQAEVNELVRGYKAEHPNTNLPGFKFSKAEPHRDRWDKLPRDDT